MNTINPIDNAASFRGRYLNLDQMEKLPPKIYDAILQNPSIDSFLKEGKPKTFIGKIIDLFRKDEMVDVRYVETKVKLPKKVIPPERAMDPYSKACNITFVYRQRNGSVKRAPMSTEQQGIVRQSGSIPKPNEHYKYKPPVMTAEEELAEEIRNIKDFKSLLK